MNDLKFAFRQLLKNPGFTAVAVLTLALGIGANTAIFGVLNELLFKPLPVKNPDSLVALVLVDGRGGLSEQSISYPIYQDYAELNRALSETIAYAPLFTRVKTTDGREMIQAQIVSGNFFSALGVQPTLGRAFSTDEDRVPLRDAVAIISRGFWTKQFNADPAVIGENAAARRSDHRPERIHDHRRGAGRIPRLRAVVSCGVASDGDALALQKKPAPELPHHRPPSGGDVSRSGHRESERCDRANRGQISRSKNSGLRR